VAVTNAQLRAAYEEFAKADDAVVDNALARAARQVNPDVWCDVADDGIAVYAAYLLNAGPGGVPERATTYLEQFKAMRDSLAAGVVVIV
jgi:hypothetical protein